VPEVEAVAELEVQQAHCDVVEAAEAVEPVMILYCSLQISYHLLYM
jgi:hypothetical protein